MHSHSEFDRSNQPDFRTLVLAAVEHAMSEGRCDQVEVARSLGYSVRSFQRELAKYGTSYSAIVTETRKTEAVMAVCESDVPLSEIAFMLGFSEQSSLTRAFKSWYGESPQSLRSRLRRNKTGGLQNNRSLAVQRGLPPSSRSRAVRRGRDMAC